MGERVWDTRVLPQSDQWAYWRDVVWDAFVPVTLHRSDEGAFHSTVRASSLGGIGVSQIRSQAQSVFRTADDISRRPGGTYFLNLPLDGPSSMSQDGRVAELQPGDFALVDSETPFELRFGETFHQVSLTIPREMLTPLLASPRHATAVRVPGDEGVGAVASAAIRAAVEQAPVLGRGEATAAAGHVAGLVALAVRGLCATPRSSAQRQLLLQAAKDELAASFADPQLSPAVVASRIAISVRYLHKLFADDGTTFGRALLHHRLETARRHLEDPAFAHLTITQLALRVGFNDPTHFGRAFRSAFHESPLSHRRRARSEQPIPALRALACLHPSQRFDDPT